MASDFDWNTWAQEQNRKPGSHAEYYLNEPTETGTKSVRDPYYSSAEYFNSANSPYGAPAEDYSMMWASSDPDALLYGQGGQWNPLTEEALVGNQDLLNAFNTGVNTPGVAQGAYTAFNTGLSPETQEALTALSGSKHSVAPDVGGEEELTKKLSQMWAPPVK